MSKRVANKKGQGSKNRSATGQMHNLRYLREAAYKRMLDDEGKKDLDGKVLAGFKQAIKKAMPKRFQHRHQSR